MWIFIVLEAREVICIPVVISVFEHGGTTRQHCVGIEVVDIDITFNDGMEDKFIDALHIFWVFHTQKERLERTPGGSRVGSCQ